MKDLLECAAQHWVFSCVVMLWVFLTADQIGVHILNSIRALTKR